MNIFERWLLRRIFKRVVIQGDHFRQVEVVLSMLWEACKAEFTEDNEVTLKGFLEQRLEAAVTREEPYG